MKTSLGILLTGVGALFGYIGTRLLGWQEKRAKRRLLIAMLKYELRRIKGTFPSYESDRVFHRDPLRFLNLDELALGNSLSYRKDGKLLRELLFLRVAVARYNDFVAVSNLIQNFGNMPDTIHREIFDQIAEYHRLVRDIKSRVLDALPENVQEIGGSKG